MSTIPASVRAGRRHAGLAGSTFTAPKENTRDSSKTCRFPRMPAAQLYNLTLCVNSRSRPRLLRAWTFHVLEWLFSNKNSTESFADARSVNQRAKHKYCRPHLPAHRQSQQYPCFLPSFASRSVSRRLGQSTAYSDAPTPKELVRKSSPEIQRCSMRLLSVLFCLDTKKNQKRSRPKNASPRMPARHPAFGSGNRAAIKIAYATRYWRSSLLLQLYPLYMKVTTSPSIQRKLLFRTHQASSN